MAGNTIGFAPFEQLCEFGLLVKPDLQIVCRGEVYSVHRVILGALSNVLEEIVATSENKTVLKFDDFPPMMKLMVEFMYTHDYKINFDPTVFCSTLEPEELEELDREFPIYAATSPKPHRVPLASLPINPFPTSRSPTKSTYQSKRASEVYPEQHPTYMVVHAFMYALAAKYNIIELKSLAMAKFKESVCLFWDTVVFPIALREAWTTVDETDRGLKDIAIDIMAEHPTLLMKNDIDLWLHEFEGLAYAVLMKKVEMET